MGYLREFGVYYCEVILNSFVLMDSTNFIKQIRIFFRLIQFSAGKNPSANGLISHESYFYALEAVPMVFAISCFIVVHPGTILPKGEKMPGLFGIIKGWICARTPRGRKQARAQDGIKLVGRYQELDGESSPPRYSSRGDKV